RRATFSSILSATFDVWTKNFVNFFVVFLVLAFVTGLIGALVSFAFFGVFGVGSGLVPGSPPPNVTTANFATLILVAIAVVVAGAIISSIVAGGMTEYAVRRYRGESMTLERALRRGFEKFLSILGANILLTIIVFALVLLPLLAIIPLAFVDSTGTPSGAPSAAIAVLCGVFLALVIGGIVALYVYVGMSLYAPAIMVENQKAIDGLMRSWRLTKGYRWSIFAAILVISLIQALIGGAILVPTIFVSNPIVVLVASALVSGLVGSWLVIVAAVAYDLIVRQPTYTAPPYFPGSPIAPPRGAASAPPPPGPMPPTGP
ncbi:MAG: DUF7544 domain-containing protein, partial [Thermoplasmata archaeon]